MKARSANQNTADASPPVTACSASVAPGPAVPSAPPARSLSRAGLRRRQRSPGQPCRRELLRQIGGPDLERLGANGGRPARAGAPPIGVQRQRAVDLAGGDGGSARDEPGQAAEPTVAGGQAARQGADLDLA